MLPVGPICINPLPLLCTRFHVFTALGPRSGSLVSRKSVVPAFVVWPAGVTPIYCASAATCPVKAGDDTAGPRGEGKGAADQGGHAPAKPRPHVTAAPVPARPHPPPGAEAGAQSMRCQPGPGGDEGAVPGSGRETSPSKAKEKQGGGREEGQLSSLPLQTVGAHGGSVRHAAGVQEGAGRPPLGHCRKQN